MMLNDSVFILELGLDADSKFKGHHIGILAQQYNICSFIHHRSWSVLTGFFFHQTHFSHEMVERLCTAVVSILGQSYANNLQIK